MSDKFIQVVFSNPVEGKDDEFNDWYDNVHIPDLLKVPGMLAARRYDLRDADVYLMEGGNPPQHRYMCVYEMEGDVNAILGKIMESVASGEAVMSDSLDLPSSRMSFWTPRGGEFRA
jgi:hypothetical protein